MSELHITWVDIAVVAILAVSTIAAIFRGFVREILSIFAWTAAIFSMLYFGHYAVPLLTRHMSLLLAEIVAYTAVFLIVLISLLLLVNRLSRRVYDSPIGGLDRFLGALFGVTRGLVGIAVLYILYCLIVPVSAQASWMRNARTLPLIQKSASALLALLPGTDAQFVEMHAKRGIGQEPKSGARNGETENLSASPAGSTGALAHHAPGRSNVQHEAYGAGDRRALNRLIETSGDGRGNQR